MDQRGSQGANFQEGAKRTVISFAVLLSKATRSPNRLSDNFGHCSAIPILIKAASCALLSYCHSKMLSWGKIFLTLSKFYEWQKPTRSWAVGIIHHNPQEVWVILKNSLSVTADLSRKVVCQILPRQNKDLINSLWFHFASIYMSANKAVEKEV